MPDRSLNAYLYLSAVFVAALVAANMVSSKIVMLGGLVVPAGVLAYSITFAITDTVGEVWGKPRAQALVKSGIAVQVLLAFLRPDGHELACAHDHGRIRHTRRQGKR